MKTALQIVFAALFCIALVILGRGLLARNLAAALGNLTDLFICSAILFAIGAGSRLSRHLSVAILLGLALALPSTVRAQDGVVVPQSVTVTNWRDTASIEYSSAVTYVQGASMRWDLYLASVAYSTNGYTAQNLSNVTVTVAVGNSTTSTTYTATLIDPTNGQARVTAPLPAYSKAYWQVLITDANTNSYRYQQQIVKAEPAL